MATLAAALCAQTLLTFSIEGEGPVRFGFPLPADAITRGLHLIAEREARLQWSVLNPTPDPRTDRVWVELAVVGARGRVRIAAGGPGPVESGSGPVVAVERHRDEPDRDRPSGGRPGGGRPGGGASADGAEPAGGKPNPERSTATVWRWVDGSVDRLRRTVFLAATEDQNGELYRAGEARSAWNEPFVERCLRARVGARQWREAGVLPPARSGGASVHLRSRAREVREQLLAAVPALPRAPGVRGRGDYLRGAGPAPGGRSGRARRGGPVVTNLEYDTILGFARLALATGDAECLRRCYESARHLVDRDLDRRSGLPFRHAAGGHRRAPPEPGHCWLSGLLLAGCVFADRELIAAARAIGRSLAHVVTVRPRPEDPRDDRMRDVAWPLWELERLLRFGDAPAVRRAADRLAAAVVERWDRAERVVRFGEGETGGTAYRERCWLTAGILLPGLRLHGARTGARRTREIVAVTERRLLRLMRTGKPGIPLHYLVRGGRTFGELRRRAAPEAYLLLDGLSARARARALARTQNRRALEDAIDLAHPDLATHWTLIARCGWILQ